MFIWDAEEHRGKRKRERDKEGEKEAEKEREPEYENQRETSETEGTPILWFIPQTLTESGAEARS